MTVLLLANFVVALAYGVALPLLPLLIERELGAGADVGLHTGLITGAYAFGLFLFAPMWGRWSDNGNRRGVLILGLCGFAAAVVVGAAIQDVVGLYFSRFLSGVFAACIVPVAQAFVVDTAQDDERRARRFAWLGISGSAGLLGGPLVGGVLGPGSLTFVSSQAALATAAVVVAALAALWLPEACPRPKRDLSGPVARRELATVLALSGVVTAGLGAFEVGMAMRGQADRAMSSAELGVIFAECMLVMAAAQALVFNPWVRAGSTARLIAPCLLLLGVALFLVAWASSGTGLLLGTGAVAAAAGILLPVLAFWITVAAGPMQGLQLGRQTSLASLGQAIGSVLAGLLAGSPYSLNGGVIVAGAVSLVAAFLALAASRRLLRLDQLQTSRQRSPRR
jgi:MFS family permease